MKKPNLLFIFTDQQRADTMSCYGNDQIETPAMNALADESFVFENAYVSQPVCSPSRATQRIAFASPAEPGAVDAGSKGSGPPLAPGPKSPLTGSHIGQLSS